MKNKLLKTLVSILTITSILGLFLNNSYAGVDLTVSPIKYEFTLDKGQSETKTIKLFNNTETDQNIHITIRNIKGTKDNGEPIFENTTTQSANSIANRVTPGISNFTIQAGSNLDIPFTLTIPNNATPGGNYGAIFFNTEKYGNGQIKIQNQIGVLIYNKVPGDTEAEGNIDNITIHVSNGGWGGVLPDNSTDNSDSIGEKIKDFILGDDNNNTNTNADNNNSDTNNENTDTNSTTKEPKNDLNSATDNGNQNSNNNQNTNPDFSVDFSIDFSNKGNVHIKPTGKIEIVDENGNVLKKIGKESIKNENGAIIGNKVVDYIPINDEDGNVFPNENRIFNQCWKGFAYETLDDQGEKTIKYYNPNEYYSKDTDKNGGYLMPWQRICSRIVNKKLTAKIDIKYTDPTGKEVEFNSAKDFNISYEEKYIGLNWYVIIPGILIFFIFFFIILFKRRKKEEKEEKIIYKKDTPKKEEKEEKEEKVEENPKRTITRKKKEEKIETKEIIPENKEKPKKTKIKTEKETIKKERKTTTKQKETTTKEEKPKRTRTIKKT
ncbi:MAG: hypothetical protein PHN31_03930 [Candidatus Gracilibacteria bacterium]|nr:hypothetical protein [Candidatus Gracilibacteria bacterium]